ncbi:hypothetical protein AWM61_03790 [Riemerella anatipestifer]|uniref:hypothetical protein n=1 Tax=Riemerella anatipestifer TaxID=34085 RepID=UPI0007ECBCB2|nr:hypothetical protein [Riemerella anatipestifer]MCW0499426.1 hypothetical protein [Riemerella anatipestifer]OBP57581.1 hypothetical protein AWM61_03790 [Riemerella anatipestifer]
MKKLFLGAVVFAAGLFGTANAQIQEGNWMVGGQVAKMRFTNGVNLNLTPQVGYFVKDNWAVGAQVNLEVASAGGATGTTTNWTLGGFTRYYFGSNEVESLLKNGRFFAEGTVGFGGINNSAGSTTNGVNLGVGAGYSYFITKNVSLDALLKFDTVTGGGNTAGNGNLGLNVGFQIYLPTSKVKAALKDQ